MTITIAGDVNADEKTRKYVEKVIGSLDKYLPRTSRESATAEVVLKRVNRVHGNKYEASVTLKYGSHSIDAADSTLNVLAALDIVRRKLALDLKSSKTKDSSKDHRLPRRASSV